MVKLNLADDQNVVRFVKAADLRRDENGDVIGVNPSAFRLRETEKYLSASHLESADQDESRALKVLYNIFIAKFSKISKGAFTVGVAGGVKDACARKAKIKIAKEPKKWNPHYTAVRQYPDDLEVREKLAAERWANWRLLKDI